MACTSTIVRRGHRGTCVSEVQRDVKAAGHDPGPIDGIFGPLTEAGVKSFQKAEGLTVDGIVGPNTWAALKGTTPAAAAEVADPAPPPDYYKVIMGELGGTNDEIQQSIIEMTISLETDLASEVRFTVSDPLLKMHNAGYFVIRRPVTYAGMDFEVASVEVRYTSDTEEVEVFARTAAVQKMKRDKGSKNFGKISPSAFAYQMADKFGLDIFAEGSPAKAAIVRQNTEQSQESTWDVLKRLASELEFVVFETDGMLYFASEEFIIENQTAITVPFPPQEGQPYYLYDMDLHRSDDELWGVDMNAEIERKNGVNIRPGMAMTLDTVPYFDKPMLVTSVEWQVPAVDEGLGDAVVEPVRVRARALEPSEDVGCELQVVKRGDTGACTKRVQQAVKAAGFSPGAIDGIFGPLTEAAVANFQVSKGIDASGVVGPETWAVL